RIRKRLTARSCPHGGCPGRTPDKTNSAGHLTGDRTAVERPTGDAPNDGHPRSVEPTNSDELGDGAAGGGDLLLGGAGNGGHRDLATLRVERGQLLQVHDLELLVGGVLEALQLREAHVEGHLPTLEALRNLVTGLGALGTTTSGLTLGRLTTTDTGLGGLGA